MNITNATTVASPVQQRVVPAESASNARLSAGSNKASPIPAQDVSTTGRSEAKTSKEAIQEAARKVEKFVSLANSEIKFSLDEDTGMSIVKVIDKATDQVIRQIPSEEVVAIARTLDKLQGLLFTGKA